MFTRENQTAYLKESKFIGGKDGEQLATATFYLTPIDYELAQEIDQEIADTLFRKNGTEHAPRQTSDTTRFLVKPEPCAMEYRLHEELKPSARIPFVQFTNLRAFKPFAGDPNFTLAFDASFPVDKDLAWELCIGRKKKTVVLSFTQAQKELELDLKVEAPKCEECDEPPRYKTQDGQRFFCTNHPRAAGEGIELVELSVEEQIKHAKKAADEELAKDQAAAGAATDTATRNARAGRRGRGRKK